MQGPEKPPEQRTPGETVTPRASSERPKTMLQIVPSAQVETNQDTRCHTSHACCDELVAGVPDMRLDAEGAADLLAAETTAYFDVEVTNMEPKFRTQIIGNIALGLTGRGDCFQLDGNIVRAYYKTASDDRAERENHIAYGDAILSLFALDRRAVKTCTIFRDPVPPHRYQTLRVVD